MSVKISIIGAGSGCFSLSLIKDICLSEHLKDSHICLMDIDRSKLDDAYTLCQRYADEVGTTLRLEKTESRAVALQDADFVVLTALAADNGRLIDGWNAAYRFGYRFGGSLHVMHDEAFWVNFYQLRLMEEIAKDILDQAPEAWLVLVANPVLAGVTLLQRTYPDLKLVGMCHGYNGVFKIAEQLGLEREQIGFEVSGVNHTIFLTDFTYRGTDAYPLIDQWIATEAAAFHADCRLSHQMGPKAVDLYRRLGRYPIGDTGNPGGGAWPHWYHDGVVSESKWREHPHSWFCDGHFVNSAGRVEQINTVVSDPNCRVLDVFPGERSREPMIPLIEGLAGAEDRTVVVNVQNAGGYVAGIPHDFEVEVPATVGRGKIAPHTPAALPSHVLRYIMRDRVLPVEAELDAYSSGDRRRLIDLILMDPWSRSVEQAEAFVDAIFALPYHEALRSHFA